MTTFAAAVVAVVVSGVGRTFTQQPVRFDRIDAVVEAAIAHQELPGAVVLIGQGDGILYSKGFGQRAIEPAPEAMTEDTIFDVASLTKVVATTTSVMQLVERGDIRLRDPVSKFIPGFGKLGKQNITIQHLLTHTSGLPPDLPLTVVFNGAGEAVRRAAALRVTAPPGQQVVYSDINFFLLGHIVSSVSGQPFERYVKTHIFDPLEMRDTGFLPPRELLPRIAPTERCLPMAWPCGTPAAPMLRGVVHDPTARRMGNVAGHAGLFSTAADLSRFCRMLLNGGSLGNAHILSPATVERMTLPSTPNTAKDVRGLGWDIDSDQSSNRGDLFPIGTSFGHTGWTGTSLWLEPRTQSYVIFLSNRVHPNGRGNVVALRGRVATIAAAALSELRAETLHEPSATHPFAGLTYIERSNTAPRPFRMHVIQVDMTAPGIRFKLSPRAGTKEVVRQTTLEFMKKEGAQAAINAHYFVPFPTMDTDVDVVGIAASEGDVYSGFEVPTQRYALLPDAPGVHFDRQNRASIVRKGAAGLWTAISGSAQIVTDGATTIPMYRDAAHPGGTLEPGGPNNYSNERSWYDAVNARTAIGLSHDSRTVTLFTVDARNGSQGLTVKETADILIREFGVWNALNLDGGGSTTMAMQDPITRDARIVNTSSDNPNGRAVGSSLAVFARAH